MAEKTNANMLFANFNQDFSCISIGTKRGYSITNCDPFGRVYTMNDGPRSIVEMLFCTSLIALVGAASPSSSTVPGAAPTPSSSRRKLQIVNTKRHSTICELLFPSSILAVKMNRKTLVIVLESEIYVYDISNMRLLHVIETQPNPEGVCALSPDVERSYLAYPAPVPSSSSSHYSSSSSHSPSGPNAPGGTGDVLLFSTRSLTVANAIQAHKTPLSHLALNQSGTLLATTSEKGTVIRVWSVPGAEKLYQFRRGAREARIYCVCFNVVGTLLAVSSAHGTVHIFKLGAHKSSSSASYSSYSSSSSNTKGYIEANTKGYIEGNTKGYMVDPMNSAKAYTVDPPKDSPRSPPESLDGRESTQLEGGYDAFAEKRGGVGSSLTRRSLHLGKSLTHSVGSYLPTSMKEMWDPQRDFASLTLPSGGVRTVVGLSSTMPHVMVISSEGYLYLYSIDLENGGECGLVKQYSLLGSVDVDPAGEVPDAAPGKS